MQRNILTDEDFAAAVEAVKGRIAKKNMQGRGGLINAHEAFGKLYEEVNVELAEEMHKNNDELFIDEAIDVAVAAIWAIASIRKNLTLL